MDFHHFFIALGLVVDILIHFPRDGQSEQAEDRGQVDEILRRLEHRKHQIQTHGKSNEKKLPLIFLNHSGCSSV